MTAKMCQIHLWPWLSPDSTELAHDALPYSVVRWEVDTLYFPRSLDAYSALS